MKNLFGALLAFVINCSCSFAQTVSSTVINTTGGSYANNAYSIDWSVGELALVNEMRSSYSVYILTNGFIQPLTGKPQPDNTTGQFGSDEIIILPNPTRGMLEININTKQQGKIKLQLFDALGNLLYKKRFAVFGYGHIERINMTGYSNSTYMLRLVLDPDPGFKNKKGSFKIIKVN